jgi:hypothetical protein
MTNEDFDEKTKRDPIIKDYVIQYDSSHMLVAKYQGSIARYANKSHAPNAEIVSVISKGITKHYLRALKQIHLYEPITLQQISKQVTIPWMSKRIVATQEVQQTSKIVRQSQESEPIRSIQQPPQDYRTVEQQWSLVPTRNRPTLLHSEEAHLANPRTEMLQLFEFDPPESEPIYEPAPPMTEAVPESEPVPGSESESESAVSESEPVPESDAVPDEPESVSASESEPLPKPEVAPNEPDPDPPNAPKENEKITCPATDH